MFKEFEEFSPLNFLDFSKEVYCNLNNFNSNTSTVKRVVYGRIYYAIFLFVREWLKDNCEYVSTHKDHTKMIKFIKNQGPFDDLTNIFLADNLTHLKKLRHQADYYIKKPEIDSIDYQYWISESLEDTFELAESIIELFANFNN